jgi:Ca-activated chloride channel homolog
MITIWKYDFYNAWVLCLLPVLIFLGFYIWKAKFRASKTLAYTGSSKSMQKLGTFNLKKWQLSQIIAFMLSFAFLIFALARPCMRASVNREELYEKQGIDIVIAMDKSNSMLAQDFTPNRLEVAKVLAIDFVAQRPNDRFGLVFYEGEAITACPLTLDHTLVQLQLQNAQPGNMTQGTAIGVGLATAVARLSDTTSKSRVIILMTDGVNNQGETTPQLAQEMAVKAGVKVYTIGIGSNAGEINIQGRRMEVKIDEQLMKDISKATGGKYFRATDENSLLEIYKKINQMETKAIKDNSAFKIPPAQPLPFLLLATMFFTMAIAIGQFKLKTLV